MAISMDAMTVRGLSAALDAAIVRQQVIASNIANADTPGYLAQETQFTLKSTFQGQRNGDAMEVSLSPRWSLTGDGAVRLDREMAAMAQNGAHYQALLRALNRHLSVLMSAASDGKRG